MHHDIKISFIHNSTQVFPSPYVFSGKDILPLKTLDVEIQGFPFQFYLFREDEGRGIAAMLCANEVCVEEIVISKRFDICRYTVSVTSPYFDGLTNLERKRIELPQSEDGVDLISPITRDDLTATVKHVCMSMITEVGGSDINSFRHKNIEKLQKYYPFIGTDALGGDASFLDAEDVVRAYRAQQARHEDQIVNDLIQGRAVSWDDVSHLASEDLARYIVHRALLIESLFSLPKDSLEDALHDAILPKGSDGSDLRSNNIWIIDDKFLAYSSVFSNQSLCAIVKRVGQDVELKNGKMPDVAIFFSNDDDGQPNRLVVVEFKKPQSDVFESNKALSQCRVYASHLVEAIGSVKEVFAFAVVDADQEFSRDLRQQQFKSVFSSEGNIFYNQYSIGVDESVPLHLYVTPPLTLLKDAKARNEVFEAVLQFSPKST